MCHIYCCVWQIFQLVKRHLKCQFQKNIFLQNLSDFRSISKLCRLFKFVEKNIKIQFMKHIKDSNLLSTTQSDEGVVSPQQLYVIARMTAIIFWDFTILIPSVFRNRIFEILWNYLWIFKVNKIIFIQSKTLSKTAWSSILCWIHRVWYSTSVHPRFITFDNLY